jgi:hypothetical protein
MVRQGRSGGPKKTSASTGHLFKDYNYDMKSDRAAGLLSTEQAKIRRRAWVASASLHLFFLVLVGIEFYLKAETFLDPVFYIFCVPGLLVGLPVAMLFALGGPHGEGVFFAISSGCQRTFSPTIGLQLVFLL